MATWRGGQRVRQALSRRDALTGMLRVGGGLLAAGLTACGPDAAAARASLRANSAPSNVGSVATATPAPIPELRINILPNSLVIPSVGLDVPVEPAPMVRNGQGRPEIVVPNAGVASPNLSLGSTSANNVWILGHSRWGGMQQPMYRLGDVRAGDLVTITGVERLRRQALPTLEFRAERLFIADLESATAEIYQRRPVPRLILQTSARQSGERAWILDRAALEPHAQYLMRSNPEDPAVYLVLLVIAELTPDSLTRLRQPA